MCKIDDPFDEHRCMTGGPFRPRPHPSIQEIVRSMDRALHPIGMIVTPVGLGAAVRAAMEDERIKVVESAACPENKVLIFDRDVTLNEMIFDRPCPVCRVTGAHGEGCSVLD